jgi:hypothetical protein
MVVRVRAWTKLSDTREREPDCSVGRSAERQRRPLLGQGSRDLANRRHATQLATLSN